MPKIVYLQAQRWGSGLPAPKSLVKSTVDICGTTYASELNTLSMVFPRPTTTTSSIHCSELDFVADDALGLYYAGDFCSHRNPGSGKAHVEGSTTPDDEQIYYATAYGRINIGCQGC
mmetsp:Transcript_46403/g.112492  ORF Transcript_46403/g.112492 Transcript_46403/m.112492 type:complete len:117 (-) Transcript_46403:180-530(-)